MSESTTIIKLGNPILRQQSQVIENIEDEKIQQLIDQLLTTVITANGVGIAAPQIAQSYRLFIVASRPNARYPHAPEMQPTAMINPRIIQHSQKVVKDWEGCLSVPGIRGLVPRYQSITVEYTDRYGNLQQQQLMDFVARIFQHEYDHLEGLVFLDRVENSQDLISEEEYQKIVKSVK